MTVAAINEIGYQNLFWGTLEYEETPELMWPRSVVVFDRMRRQDAQVGSVLRAVTLPVRRTPWRIDPNGAEDEVVEHVADDLGLPIVGYDGTRTPQRTRDRFSWNEHVRMALLMLAHGHSFFEQQYRIDDVRKPGGVHLQKLAWRPARSIANIEVAEDGGLVGIWQWGVKKMIPVTQLVAYVNEREGANWLGQSLLRTAYKNWLIKDDLLRTDSQTIRRNGMGVPVYKGFPGEGDSDPGWTKGLAVVKSFRAGETAAAAIDNGAEIDLKGVDGTLPQAMPSIRYHDEQIARAVLAHFLNLGTQTGSWALGATFEDFFTMCLQTVADDVASVTTAHVVEDLVDQNWGVDAGAPKIVFDEIGSHQKLTAQAVKMLIESGAFHADPTLEQTLRQQYGLPPLDPNAVIEPQQDPPVDPTADPSMQNDAPGNESVGGGGNAGY
jgi:hypothetical protein